MADKYTLTLYGQVPSKKNSKRIVYNRATHKPFVISSEKALDWKKDAHWQLYELGKFSVKGAVAIQIEIWNADKRRHDLENQASTILDFLVDEGVIEDDNQFIVFDLQVMYSGIDKENPRAIITIMKE